TDRDGGVDGATAARILAGCGTDAAANRSERVRRPRDEVGLFLASRRDELDVAPGIGGDGTPGLALDLCLPVLEIGESGRDGHERLGARGGSRRVGALCMTKVMWQWISQLLRRPLLCAQIMREQGAARLVSY